MPYPTLPMPHNVMALNSSQPLLPTSFKDLETDAHAENSAD